MIKKCPKCGYIRGENEISQEYECQKCGIVFAKYEAFLKKKETEELTKPSTNGTSLISAEAKGIKIQNFIMLIWGSVVMSMIMFPPFCIIAPRGTYNAGYAFILNPPNSGYATVNSSMLSVQIIVCVVLGCISLFILKNSEKRLWAKKTKKPVSMKIHAVKERPQPNVYLRIVGMVAAFIMLEGLLVFLSWFFAETLMTKTVHVIAEHAPLASIALLIGYYLQPKRKSRKQFVSNTRHVVIFTAFVLFSSILHELSVEVFIPKQHRGAAPLPLFFILEVIVGYVCYYFALREQSSKEKR